MKFIMYSSKAITFASILAAIAQSFPQSQGDATLVDAGESQIESSIIGIDPSDLSGPGDVKSLDSIDSNQILVSTNSEQSFGLRSPICEPLNSTHFARLTYARSSSHK